MHRSLVPVLLLAGTLASGFRPAFATLSRPPESGNYILPLNCSELLPDTSPFTGFFEAVGKGAVAKDRKFAKQIFKVMALRDRMAEIPDKSRETNPVDTLIRRTLCFYREQKDPVRPVGYDDVEFVKFLKGSMKELEGKVEDIIFQAEYDRQQRRQYEQRLEKNQGVVTTVRREADLDADKSFDKIMSAAKKKVRAQ